jgi:glycosyltransferase involved in cell wall biosynthesis
MDIVSQATRRLLKFSRHQPWRLPGLLVNHLATVAQERLFLGACSEIWATTESEAALLRALAPSANVVVAGNAIDEQLVQPSAIPAHGPIGLIGNYSLAPNLDAACFLAERVFPIVKRTHTEARLALAGGGMPSEVCIRLARIAGVDLLGQVEDSAAFIQSCRVMALTVRVRGGVPLKLIESLACSRPVVATLELIDGLSLRIGTDVLVGDSAKEIAAALCRMLDDGDLARSVAASGHERFVAEFSLASTLRRLKDQSLLARAPVRT